MSLDSEAFRYATRVHAIPQLGRDEELALARAYRDRRDAAAGHAIVSANLRHVVAQAMRYRHFKVGLSELIAIGNLALMTALERFEPERGLRFATYANHWIRAEMLIAVLRTRSLVDGGRGHLRGRYVFRLRREHAHLHARYGDEDRVVEKLSQRFERTPEEIRAIVARLDGADASLDARGATGSGPSMLEQLCSDRPASEELLDQRQTRAHMRDRVQAATADLSSRERYIVERRLMSDEPLSLSQVGTHFGITGERARQLEAAVKQKLRKRLLKLQLASAPGAPA